MVLLIGVEAVGRLVEDQDLGIVQQRDREADPALEALRERLDRLPEHALQLEQIDHGVDARRLVAPSKPRSAAANRSSPSGVMSP